MGMGDVVALGGRVGIEGDDTVWVANPSDQRPFEPNLETSESDVLEDNLVRRRENLVLLQVDIDVHELVFQAHEIMVDVG